MSERLTKNLKPEAQQALRLAHRLAGKQPVLKQVPSLPNEVRAMLVRPRLASGPYEIHVASGQQRVLEHLIAHEVGHIVRLHSVPEEQRLAPYISQEARHRAFEQVLPELARLADRGLPENALAGLFHSWFESVVVQLANFPADLRIEAWIHKHFPGLRPIQRRSLTWEVERGFPFFQPSVSLLTPPTIYRSTMAMNAAQAFHVAELHRKRELAAPYEQHGYDRLGMRLVQFALTPEDHGHQSDMQATQEWAGELGITGWFDWLPYRSSVDL